MTAPLREQAPEVTAPLSQTSQTDWRELCRRLYVELFSCDQQMTGGLRPKWVTGKEVLAVLADAKSALSSEASQADRSTGPTAIAQQGLKRAMEIAYSQGWSDHKQGREHRLDAEKIGAALRDVQAVDLTHGQWISVNERLPESRLLCLVLIGEQVQVAQFDPLLKSAKWWDAYGVPSRLEKEPSHWMPLPAMPSQKALDQGSDNREAGWLENQLLEALVEINDRIKKHPMYANLTEEEECEIGGDTAELSYLSRVASNAIEAAKGVHTSTLIREGHES